MRLNRLLQASWVEPVLHANGYCRKPSATSRLSEGGWKSRAILVSPRWESYVLQTNSRIAEFNPGILRQRLIQRSWDRG